MPFIVATDPAAPVWPWNVARSIAQAPLWPVLFLLNILLSIVYYRKDGRVDMGHCLSTRRNNDRLTRLPEEILLSITSYMGPHELLSFSSTSRRLRQLSQASILFWSSSIVPPLLPRRVPIEQHSAQELQRTVLRSTRNRLVRDGSIGPSLKRVEVHLNGIASINSEKLIPGTSLFICAIGSSEMSTCQLVLVDLHIGKVVSQVKLAEELSDCVIGVKAYSNVSFDIAVMGRVVSQERLYLWQIFSTVVSQGNGADINADIVCEAQGSLDAGEDEFLREIKITKEMLIFQKCHINGHWQLCGLFRRRQPTNVVLLRDEAIPISWDASDDWVISYLPDEGIQLDFLASCLDGFSTIRYHREDIVDLCSHATSIHFDTAAYPLPTGNGPQVCDGVVQRRQDGSSVLSFFRISLSQEKEGIEVKRTGSLVTSIELQRSVYSNSHLWCTDETKLYVMRQIGGKRRLDVVPGLELGYFELVDVEAGLVCTGQIKATQNGPVTGLIADWFTPC